MKLEQHYKLEHKAFKGLGKTLRNTIKKRRTIEAFKKVNAQGSLIRQNS